MQEFEKQVRAARGRQAELAEVRTKLQAALHARLAETGEAERDPKVIELRAAIKALQAEKYDLDQGLSAASKPTHTLSAE